MKALIAADALPVHGFKEFLSFGKIEITIPQHLYLVLEGKEATPFGKGKEGGSFFQLCTDDGLRIGVWGADGDPGA
jgi:hypothetical protein